MFLRLLPYFILGIYWKPRLEGDIEYRKYKMCIDLVLIDLKEVIREDKVHTIKQKRRCRDKCDGQKLHHLHWKWTLPYSSSKTRFSLIKIKCITSHGRDDDFKENFQTLYVYQNYTHKLELLFTKCISR